MDYPPPPPAPGKKLPVRLWLEKLECKCKKTILFEGFEFRSRTLRLFYANFFFPSMFRFSYSSWFVVFHFSVSLWDNDTFIWIYSKRETAKKKKRLSFKTMAMRAYKFRSTLLSTTSFAYTHMTYTVCKLYFISRISLETKVFPLIHQFFRLL